MKISKKEKILKEALKLFAVQGVGNTSTAEITKKAGVAEGTLFVHFKNKQALVDAVYLETKQHEVEVFEAAVMGAKTAEEFVRTLGKTAMRYFVKNYSELIFIQNVALLQLVSRNTVNEANKYFIKFGEKLTAWQEQGELKKLDVEMLHHIMWAILVVLIHYCKRNKAPITDELIDPLWDAVRA